MFVVLSFDFCNSGDVRVHAVTPDRRLAEDVYVRLSTTEKFTVAEPTESRHTLLELQEIPDGFVSERGSNFFWGTPDPRANVLMSNNHA